MLPVRFLPILHALAAAALAQEPWHLFEDPRTGNLGYRDAVGRVTVPALLSQPTAARVFRNIVAVFEADTSGTATRSQAHFLRRDGSAFGHDSVPLLGEFTPPCESEGTILFQDPLTRRLGYFDSTGKVAIPARYMDAGGFHGGYAVVLPEGRRMCGDGKPRSSRDACEHWSWEGAYQLIDRRGAVVVDSFRLPPEAVPDWLRGRRGASDPDTARLRLRTVDGDTLFLPDHLREFRAWFAAALPRLRRKGARRDDFLPRIHVSPDRDWKSGRAAKAREGSWPATDPVKFAKEDGRRLARFLAALDRRPARIDIAEGGSFLHAAGLGLQDDCGDPDPVRRPVFEVRSLAPDGLLLRSLTFVRTPQGFRIAEVD